MGRSPASLHLGAGWCDRGVKPHSRNALGWAAAAAASRCHAHGRRAAAANKLTGEGQGGEGGLRAMSTGLLLEAGGGYGGLLADCDVQQKNA